MGQYDHDEKKKTIGVEHLMVSLKEMDKMKSRLEVTAKWASWGGLCINAASYT